ncbi:MAG: hypothetical protein ACRBDI_10025 [Alphaproteobacteria bacterium]
MLLCACDESDTKSSSAAEQKCPNEKIRVEMGGNLLEFERDEVRYIYIPNPDKENTLRKYKDVSKDCSVEFQEGVEIVSGIRTDMVVGFLGLSIPKERNGKYFDQEYDKKLEKYNNKVTKYDHGVLHVLTNDENGFYVLTETEQREINGNPVAFSCAKWHGCSTYYVHPSGLGVSISKTGSYDVQSSYLFENLKIFSHKIDTLFVERQGEK